MTIKDSIDELRDDIDELRGFIESESGSGESAAEDVVNKVDIEMHYLWEAMTERGAAIEELREEIDKLRAAK
jgi:hypothetical protein